MPDTPLKHSVSPWKVQRDPGGGYALIDATGEEFATLQLRPGYSRPGDLPLIVAAPLLQEGAADVLALTGEAVIRDRARGFELPDEDDGIQEATMHMLRVVRESAGLPTPDEPASLPDADQREYVAQLRAMVPPAPPTPEPDDGQ